VWTPPITVATPEWSDVVVQSAYATKNRREDGADNEGLAGVAPEFTAYLDEMITERSRGNQIPWKPGGLSQDEPMSRPQHRVAAQRPANGQMKVSEARLGQGGATLVGAPTRSPHRVEAQ
jgi:hypothetical protein